MEWVFFYLVRCQSSKDQVFICFTLSSFICKQNKNRFTTSPSQHIQYSSILMTLTHLIKKYIQQYNVLICSYIDDHIHRYPFTCIVYTVTWLALCHFYLCCFPTCSSTQFRTTDNIVSDHFLPLLISFILRSLILAWLPCY